MTGPNSSQIVVATVEGRSYYKIVSMLKSINIGFSSLSPEEASRTNAKIIITTKNEASLIRRGDLIFDFQLDTSPALFKAMLLKNLSGNYIEDILVVGVDPGNRIGICVLYLHTELYRYCPKLLKRGGQIHYEYTVLYKFQ